MRLWHFGVTPHTCQTTEATVIGAITTQLGSVCTSSATGGTVWLGRGTLSAHMTTEKEKLTGNILHQFAGVSWL